MSNSRENYTRVYYPSDIVSSKNPLVILASFPSCMYFLKFNFTSLFTMVIHNSRKNVVNWEYYKC